LRNHHDGNPAMTSTSEKVVLPPIPAKRYFTIGEVSELCGVKPHVLRYWEQEFTQLKPVKRRGNRRYYQHHEVLLIRRIRELLYEQGFTINGARNRLDSHGAMVEEAAEAEATAVASVEGTTALVDVDQLRKELLHVLDVLGR
jgi:DNA-binding transcriptional MerR regulator